MCFVDSFAVSYIVAWLALFIIVMWITWLSASPFFSFFSGCVPSFPVLFLFFGVVFFLPLDSPAEYFKT